MAERELIVRERELAELVAALKDAAAGNGSVVLVSGGPGSGRSTLLRALEEQAATREPLDRMEVVRTTCYEIDRQSPLAPFLEILRGLVTEDRRWTRAKRTLELVRDIAPPLLGLIPGLGGVAALGVKSAAAGAIQVIGDRDVQRATTHVSVAHALRAVAKETPLALLVDDGQWLDDASGHVLERLATMDDAPLAVVVAHDAALESGHPLTRAAAQAAPTGRLRRVALADLDAAEIARTLERRYGAVPHPRLPEWLHDHTDGTPYFLLEYLRGLEEAGVLREDGGAWSLEGEIAGEPGHWRLGGGIARVSTPSDMLEILQPQVERLEPDELALLRSGAIQGKHFLARVVAKTTARDEGEVDRLLQEVATRRQLIAPQESLDWWTERSERYTFDPGPLRDVLYERYERGAFRRKEQHRAVADALEELLADEPDPPRHALLELARHRELALQPLPAATRLVEVAASVFEEGGDREAAALGEHALRLLETVRLDGPGEEERRDASSLLARALLLVLLGGEAAWRSERTSAGVARLFELAERAESAARESGDLRLQADARYAAARVRVAHDSLEAGLEALGEARELARRAGDPLAELAVLVALGHHRVSKDLSAGRKVLGEAQELLASGALAGVLDGPRLAVEAARLDSVVGVAEFDLGRYGEALRLLARAAEELDRARQRYDAAWALAFLAQLQTAIGLYEEARASLARALGIFAEDHGALGTRGYLRALLGRTYVEEDPPRFGKARQELEEARQETTASGYRPVLPLVRTHWAELLVAEASEASLADADAVLAETAHEAQEFGWVRSEIAAASLRARVAAAAGRIDEAVELSGAAVARLSECGGAVPAVRSEEILYTHHRVLSAAGSADASAALAEAARVVREKALSLAEHPEYRRSYERVRLSRAILAAAGA